MPRVLRRKSYDGSRQNCMVIGGIENEDKKGVKHTCFTLSLNGLSLIFRVFLLILRMKERFARSGYEDITIATERALKRLLHQSGDIGISSPKIRLETDIFSSTEVITRGDGRGWAAESL